MTILYSRQCVGSTLEHVLLQHTDLTDVRHEYLQTRSLRTFYEYLRGRCFYLPAGSKTHKRLKERFLIRRNRTKRIFVLFRLIKNRSFNLLCVLDLFSERWQSAQFQIGPEGVNDLSPAVNGGNFNTW